MMIAVFIIMLLLTMIMMLVMKIIIMIIGSSMIGVPRSITAKRSRWRRSREVHRSAWLPA
jgi:hypothetical protein